MNQNKLENKLPVALYIVATPIGNLGDISERAVETLSQVDLILAEDTRHSGILLAKLGIKKSMMALHEHNEKQKIVEVVDRLKNGSSIALVSDAGTPLISDPGFKLVRLAQEEGIQVIPIPGPSAFLAALSASGLPCDTFIFLGFLPSKKTERQKFLKTLENESKTLIFYEAPHRVQESLNAMAEIFGSSREAVIAKELTKNFETIKRANLGTLIQSLQHEIQIKGEFVILVAGKPAEKAALIDNEILEMLKILMQELPLKQAVKLVSEIKHCSKKDLYKEALKIKQL